VAEEDRSESDLIVRSPAMRRTWELMRRASSSDERVLLLGESGTGKTVLARRIHELSRRRAGPFVEVALTSDVGSENMVQSDLFGHERGAFTGAGEQKQGLFSLADGGTIFLDEIGDATPDVQAKLLRVLETSTFRRLGSPKDLRVDVRVIAATNRDLEARVAEGKFREDLYYRLAVIPIRLPPLRDRAGEIVPLADYLLARAAARSGSPRRVLDPEAARLLADHAWPGNIRELDHALKYAAALAEGGPIRAKDLPEGIRRAPGKQKPAPAAGPSRVVDTDALQAALRAGGAPPTGKGNARHHDPRHIDSAKRLWLATLIDEFDGDLAMAARYWDRSSEKTLRSLVKAYGLGDALAVARARRSRP
jgi:DNA-binding NtrC family response regulator